MKAEERKELQKNDLAAGLEKLVSGFSEGYNKNTVMYLTGGLAVVALVVAMGFTWKYFLDQSRNADADRWEELNRLDTDNAWSVTPEELQKFADDKKNADTPQARVAQFELARYYAQQGSREFGTRDRRGDAVSNVKKARDLYVKLIDKSSDSPALAQEALLGAAKGSETLGDLDQAKKYYEKLHKDYPQSVYGQDATKALERINKNSADVEALGRLFDETKLP